MLNEYKKFLIKSGYATITQTNKPSTVYDYLRGLKTVALWEGKTIDELAESISTICPMYQKGAVHEVRGRQISRSVRNSLKQVNKFVSELQVA